MTTVNDLSAESKSSIRRLILCALWLSFPIWALVLTLALLSLFRGGAQTPSEPLILFGALAPFAGAFPIFRMSATGPIAKGLLFIAYYVASAVAMFVVGWVALGLFGLAK